MFGLEYALFSFHVERSICQRAHVEIVAVLPRFTAGKEQTPCISCMEAD